MTTAIKLYHLILSYLNQKTIGREAIINITITEKQNEFLTKEFSSKFRDYPVEANEYLQHQKFFKIPVEISEETGKEDYITINIKDSGLHELAIN